MAVQYHGHLLLFFIILWGISKLLPFRNRLLKQVITTNCILIAVGLFILLPAEFTERIKNIEITRIFLYIISWVEVFALRKAYAKYSELKKRKNMNPD
ncbi:hypothetical protein JW935_11970 [candidate division KSB1 bacterium]|nr:hypothetical protein [candidate division KSB1 bacterium]